VLAGIDTARGELVRKIAAENAISIALVRREFQRLAMVCELAGDRTNAIRCWEDLAKTIGGFTEGVTIDLVQVREFTETERREAKRITAVLLQGGDVPALPAAPATQASISTPAKTEAMAAQTTLGQATHDDAMPGQANSSAGAAEDSAGAACAQPPKPSDSNGLSNPEQSTPKPPSGAGVSESITPSSKYPASELPCPNLTAPPAVPDTSIPVTPEQPASFEESNHV